MDLLAITRKVCEELGQEAINQAVRYAQYKTQNDFNTKLIEEVASKTGHETLASTIFVETSLGGSGSNLNYQIYTEEAWIDGVYQSNSSFHPGSNGWSSIGEHYGMSNYEFWELKAEGYSGNAGGVDSDWLVDNFWKGIEYYTNGWPLRSAEYLFVGTRSVVSAESVVNAWIARYKANKTYQNYIIEALG